MTPIIDFKHRIPEAGRIRFGKKKANQRGGRAFPSALKTLRFTSPDRELIEEAAAQFGGTAQVWDDPSANPRNQFEVISTSTEIPVYVLPEGLAINYEKWSGGGVEWRCDGIECELAVATGQDKSGDTIYDMVKVECQCRKNMVRECDPTTRLNVIIPSLPFKGVWRVESKGWNAMAELPGMVNVITQLQQTGMMVQAQLGVDVRETMKNGRKKNFVVPRLGMIDTPIAIQQGLASVGALTTGGTRLALSAGSPAAPAPAPAASNNYVDEEIVEAEEIDDDLLEIEELLSADARNFGMDADRFIAAIKKQVAKHPEDERRTRMRNASSRMRAGEITPLGIQANGTLSWKVGEQ